MKSGLLIHTIKESEVSDKRMLSEEYITDLFVYTKTPNLDLLFRKDTNKLYTVDDGCKGLTEVQKNDEHINQVAQLKKMISSIKIKETELSHNKVKYTIEGDGNEIIIRGEIITFVMEELKLTANYHSYKKSQETSLFDLKFPINTFVESSSISINMQGNKILSKSKTTHIALIVDNINKYDYIYNYQILSSKPRDI